MTLSFTLVITILVQIFSILYKILQYKFTSRFHTHHPPIPPLTHLSIPHTVARVLPLTVNQIMPQLCSNTSKTPVSLRIKTGVSHHGLGIMCSPATPLTTSSVSVACSLNSSRIKPYFYLEPVHTPLPSAYNSLLPGMQIAHPSLHSSICSNVTLS